jgi:hypothetical protein
VPTGEAILRDLLLGQEWLRQQGITQEPRLAYFPDCFGHSPNLPALLNAAGFDRSAVTRIDGMWFMSADLDLPHNFPLPGSSAERLLKQERCLDFTWRAAGGSQVLCHWNAFTYGQGDTLADAGMMRIYLYPWMSKPDRSDKRIARRVGEYLRQLAPLARTPYLFCPIGWDFNPPIPALRELLERYNRNVYPDSGVWLVNAGMDDYFDLIEPYREKLPLLELDPNPYWTGFYTSRPSLKQRAFRLVERLSLCEQLGALCGEKEAVRRELEELWWPAAVSNHHDFITGTAPDRVAYGEQAPLLDEALEKAGAVLTRLQAGCQFEKEGDEVRLSLPQCAHDGAKLFIDSRYYHLELDAPGGGRVASLAARDGQDLLAGPSHILAQYEESGGLWRMGCEFRGGKFQEARLALPPVEFLTCEENGYLRVDWQTRLPGNRISQSLWISDNDPLLYFQVEGRAVEKSTLVTRYVLPFQPGELLMEAPGGLVRRPLARVYRRHFWPVQRFLRVSGVGNKRGFALLLRFPGAAAVGEDGRVELITQRNAIRERAYGFLNLLGMPATGIEREPTRMQYALAFPAPGEEAALPGLARGLACAPWANAEEHLSVEAMRRLVEIDSSGVFVAAIKPAWRGEGWILRFEAPSAPLPDARVTWKGTPARHAWYAMRANATCIRWR